jgi:glycosyltransferase involved in cell wall biosynthesis
MLHGGYSKNRMTDELFQALAALPEHFRLVMTCDSPEAEQRLRDLGLLDRVIRLPICDYHSMLRFTVNADAGVLLYCNNDLGNFFTAPGRLTEYLACGLPVIASDHTGIESLVLKFRLGASVTAAEPASIAAGLLRLRDLVSAGALPSDHCRAQFLKHFAIDHWKKAICGGFNAVLTEGRDRGASPPPWPWMPTANAD